MNPKTLTLLIWGIIALYTTHGISAEPIALDDPRQPSLLINFDECTSFSGGSQFDYTEFTALENNFPDCSQLTLVGPANVYRTNVSGNAHSCTPGVGNSLGMCIDGSPNCNYDPGSVKSLKFNVQVTPGPSGIGSLDGISFFEQAPDNFNFNLGEQGLNNYPQFIGMRVLANGVEVYRQEGIPTNRFWTFMEFDFKSDSDFQVRFTTVFNFEILPYCPVGNASQRIIWDIDQLEITGNCNNIFSGNISTNDITDICANTGTGGIVEVNVRDAFGPLQSLIVTDENNNIIQLPTSNVVDFRSFRDGSYIIYNVAYESGLTGLSIGNNISQLTGCFDVSNTIVVNNSRLNGGRLVFDDGSNQSFICDNSSGGNQVLMNLSNTTGRFTSYILADRNNNIIQTFQGPGFDFSVFPEGIYNIVAATHNGQLINSVAGVNISQLRGCFSLSNIIRVTKEILLIGSISIDGNTQVSLCGVNSMSVSPVINGPTSPNIRWVAVGQSGAILNIFNGLPINISNFIEPNFDVRLLSFVGTLTNFEVNAMLSDVEGCFVLSNPIRFSNLQVDGGSIRLDGGATSIEVCVDDGDRENLLVTLTGNIGSQASYAILDANQNILNITNDNVFNFENVPVGVCTIVHISSEGALTGFAAGNNINEIDGCLDISNGITVTRLERFDCEGGCNVEGGILSLDPVTICAGVNGTPMLDGRLASEIGNEQRFVITDATGIIIDLFDDFPIDVSALSNGDYLAYNIASFDDTGVMVGDNISDIDHDCFDVSDAASFTIVENNAGSVSFDDGTLSMQICVSDIIDNILTFTNDGSSQVYQYVITDDNDIILDVVAQDAFDFNNAPAGICRVWGVASAETINIQVAQPIASVSQGSICVALSDNFLVVERFSSDGGMINLESNRFCVGDGMPDLVSGTITDTVGNFFQLIVTDADSTIIDLPNPFPFDVETAPAGTCLIWSLASNSDIELQVGLRISDISSDCFDISEPAEITRTTNFGGTVSLEGGVTEIDICVGDTIVDVLEFMTTGMGLNYQYIITDTLNVILGLPSGNTVNFNNIPAGVCRVYGIAHNAIYSQSLGDVLALPSFPNSCFDFSDNFIQVNRIDEGGICGEECIANAGVISISASQFCVGDGEADLLDANVVGALGDFMQWIITDADSLIVAIPDMLPVDLDGVTPGSCILWNIASADTISIILGQSIADIDLECFDISEGNSFDRIENFGGNVFAFDNITSIDLCLTDTLSDIITFFNDGTANMYRYVITDENDIIIALPLDNTFDFSTAPAGVCRVYGIAIQSDIELFVGQELTEFNSMNNCIDLSNNFITVNRFDSGVECGEMICVADGGQVDLEINFFCVGDGEPDLVDGTITGSEGANMQLIVTDADSIIIGLPGGFPIDVDNSGPGSCIIWNLASQDPIELLIGSPISSIQDTCFDLSNAAPISRVENFGGVVNLDSGEQSATVCVGDSIANVLFFENTGSGVMYHYIVTDEDNIIIGLPGDNMVDFEGAGVGVCRVWGIAHEIDLSFQIGDPLIEPDNIGTCYDLSNNFVEITRSEDNDACDACVAQRNTCTGDEVGYIFDDITVAVDSNVCIPLKVTNFVDVITFQGGIMWDSTALQFTGTQNYALAGMTAIGSFNIDTLGGIGSFVWFDNTGGAGATTLADSSTVFEICFDVIGEDGDKSLIKVVDTDDTIIQVSNEASVYEFCVDDGCVTIVENNPISNIFTLIADDIVTIDTTVCVDVRATNFDGITGMQFAMQWDSTFMCFDSIANNNELIGIFPGSFFQGNQADRIRLTWNNSETTLPDGTLLFSVCLSIKEGNCDSTSFFNFIDDRVPIEISMGTTSIPFDLDNGSVTLEDCTNLVVGEDITFVISPNPSDELVSIHIEEMPDHEYALIVHNSYGELIHTKKSMDTIMSNELSVTDWPEGIYYMTIISKNKKSTEKFIVIHR